MLKLHIIVHEEAVVTYDRIGSTQAKQVLEEIARIKRECTYLEIPDHFPPGELPHNMPAPSPDLEVLVSGGYTYTCCTGQLLTLKYEGYNAKFNPEGCFKGNPTYSPLYRTAISRYPDFYDGIY